MKNEEYNGWTNWETWVVALWLDNDGDFEEFGQQARSHTLNAYHFGQHIRERIEERAGEAVPGANLFSDIVNGALRSVNWTEIAENIIEAYKPEEEEK